VHEVASLDQGVKVRVVVGFPFADLVKIFRSISSSGS